MELIMTRTMNLEFENKEFKVLVKAKKRLGFKTWKEMFLTLAQEDLENDVKESIFCS
jgi:hypothetical protein